MFYRGKSTIIIFFNLCFKDGPFLCIVFVSRKNVVENNRKQRGKRKEARTRKESK